METTERDSCRYPLCHTDISAQCFLETIRDAILNTQPAVVQYAREYVYPRYCNAAMRARENPIAWDAIETWVRTDRGLAQWRREQDDNRLLHQLWTKAVGTPGYDKSQWQELERRLIRR